jgi:hypothetical protein
MSDAKRIDLDGRSLPARWDEIAVSDTAVLVIGRPVCPACQVTGASLEAIGAARPDVLLVFVEMWGPEDWAIRKDALWPRGIRVSPSAVPLVALLKAGTVVATRHGAIPAHGLDAWIAESFGPAANPVPEGITDAEQEVLDRTAGRRAQHNAVKGR